MRNSFVKPAYEEPESPTVYKLYPYRFVIVVIYTIGSIVNNLISVSFAPILSQLQSVYNISLPMVTFSTLLVSSAVYGPASFFCNWFIDKFGFKNAVWAAGIMTAGGMWVRCLCTEGFYFITLGQLIVSMVGPFFTNAQKVSGIWFGVKERAMSTTVMLGLLPFGNALGAQMSGFFIGQNDAGQTFINNLQTFMIFSAGLASVAAVFIVLLFRDKPPTPPSRSAEKKRPNYFKNLKNAVSNKNFMLVALTLSFYTGILTTMPNMIQPLTQPFNVSNDDSANIISLAIVGGFILNFVASGLVTKTKTFKMWIILFSGVGTVGIGFINYMFSLNNSNLIIIVSIVTISFGLAAIPSSFEFLVEVSFPVPEEISGSFYSLGYQIIGVFAALWASAVVQDGTASESIQVVWVFFGIEVVVTLLMMFFKEDLRRKKYESHGSFVAVDADGEQTEQNEKHETSVAPISS